MVKKLFLLDGMALVYRAHFAFINRPILTTKGVNTSALACTHCRRPPGVEAVR